MVLNKLRDGKAPVISPLTRWITCRKSRFAAAPPVPLGKPDELSDIVPSSAETGGANVDTIASIVRNIYRKRFTPLPGRLSPIAQRFMASGNHSVEKLMRFLGAELLYSATAEIERFVTNERGGYDINGLIRRARRAEEDGDWQQRRQNQNHWY